VVAAGSSWLASPVGDGWLAVGDAAATFDPLSSQGIVTALVMGREAGRAIAQSCATPEDADGARAQYESGYQRLVDTYRRERREHYAAEWRWRDHPFWARRRQPAANSATT
jgi:flavin-dependent dehydrogenase